MRVPRPLVCVTTATSLIVLGHAAPNALARNKASGKTCLHVRQWFQRLRQTDKPRNSCCGEADAFEANLFEIDKDRYVAIITDGKGEIPNGTKIPMPNQQIERGRRKSHRSRHYSSESKDRFTATLSLAECDRLRGCAERLALGM